MVRHTVADELFVCIWPFVGLALKELINAFLTVTNFDPEKL